MVELQDWDMLLSDKVKRSHLLFPEKEKAERYIVSLPFGLEKKDRVIDGVVKGQNLQNLFSDLTIGYHDSVDFNSFLIPFACVAVDMVSGKDYVFHKGSLPLAMRASMAIPAVFTPVRLDSMVLVDGGLNNNYPVDVALAMGADIVIGVDLATSDLRSYDRLHSPGDIATQIIALHGYDKYERNRDRTDLLFRPDMEPYRSSSFAPAALDTMLHRGEADARRRWNEIMALKRRIGLSDTDTFFYTVAAPGASSCFACRYILCPSYPFRWSRSARPELVASYLCAKGEQPYYVEGTAQIHVYSGRDKCLCLCKLQTDRREPAGSGLDLAA